jgi:hypothetical protein
LQRIGDLEEWELIEIGIPGTNSADPMLAHQDCRVCLVQQIAGDVGELGDNLLGDVGVPLFAVVQGGASARARITGGERETLHDRPVGDRAIKKKPRRSGAVTSGLFGRHDVLHRRFFGFGLLAVFIGTLQ